MRIIIPPHSQLHALLRLLRQGQHEHALPLQEAAAQQTRPESQHQVPYLSHAPPASFTSVYSDTHYFIRYAVADESPKPPLPEDSHQSPVSDGNPDEVEMTEIPLSLFAFAGAGVHAVHLGPKDPKRFNAQVLAQCVAGVLYGCAIGDAIGVGSEYMSPNEVMTHYPSLAERVHFESASTSVLQCSFALTSEGSMVEIESPSISTLPPAAPPTHPTLQFPIQYSEFIRDRHRSSWGVWASQ